MLDRTSFRMYSAKNESFLAGNVLVTRAAVQTQRQVPRSLGARWLSVMG